MSAPIQPAAASRIDPASVTSAIGAGDWGAYQRHAKFCSKTDVVASKENLNAFRRLCALAYLGKNAEILILKCQRSLSLALHQYITQIVPRNNLRSILA